MPKSSAAPYFSCVIPAKSEDDPGLKVLIGTIVGQDFPREQIEIIVVTEGDSEKAASIGIKRARGEVIVILNTDNALVFNTTFKRAHFQFTQNDGLTGLYSRHYFCIDNDYSLSRYFAILGANDPVAYYLKKADRLSQLENNASICEETFEFDKDTPIPTLGCNGFFIRREDMLLSDLDHFYHIDNIKDIILKKRCFFRRVNYCSIAHLTANNNLIQFLRKRYKYARNLYCDRTDRRWKMLDRGEDYWRLGFFILATLTVVQPLMLSIRGFIKTRDPAIFWHWPVCMGFLITYGVLTIRWKLSQLLSRLLGGKKALKTA